jgi:hypothetical protein
MIPFLGSRSMSRMMINQVAAENVIDTSAAGVAEADARMNRVGQGPIRPLDDLGSA